MILYYTGGWGGKLKYDLRLCDVGGGGVGDMIWAELVFYPADPATHPFRIETRHSYKTFLAKLNQTLSINCLTYVKSTCQRLVWMVDVVNTTLNNVQLNNSKRV